MKRAEKCVERIGRRLRRMACVQGIVVGISWRGVINIASPLSAQTNKGSRRLWACRLWLLKRLRRGLTAAGEATFARTLRLAEGWSEEGNGFRFMG